MTSGGKLELRCFRCISIDDRERKRERERERERERGAFLSDRMIPHSEAIPFTKISFTRVSLKDRSVMA